MEQLESVVQATTNQSLVVPDVDAIKQELRVVESKPIEEQTVNDPELVVVAQDFVKSVLAFDPDDPRNAGEREKNINSVVKLGDKTQQEAGHRSAMLKQSIGVLATRAEDGGPVAKALVDLDMQLGDLDPMKVDFNEHHLLTRFISHLPGVGKPVERYFIKFQSADNVIAAIIESLKEGKAQLERDNITLAHDQQEMRGVTIRLNKVIQLGMLIDQQLSGALARIEVEPRKKFIEDELLFPLRQRIQDFQQQLAVNQQGVIAMEIIIRNNRELIRGVDRALNVTVNALSTAVTVAMALANQRIVLTKINLVNQTTNHLIDYTATLLKEQGTAIHKQAANTQLDMETLKRAFTKTREAMDEISEFRSKALPLMAQNILQLDEMTKASERDIIAMEEGNRAVPAFQLDVLQ